MEHVLQADPVLSQLLGEEAGDDPEGGHGAGLLAPLLPVVHQTLYLIPLPWIILTTTEP